MIHLYAPPGDWPASLCPRNTAWNQVEPAVYFCDLDRVDCPDCLGRVEIPTAEPYDDDWDAAAAEADDVHPLAPAFGFLFACVLMLPFWIALLIAIWRSLHG